MLDRFELAADAALYPLCARSSHAERYLQMVSFLPDGLQLTFVTSGADIICMGSNQSVR